MASSLEALGIDSLSCPWCLLSVLSLTKKQERSHCHFVVEPDDPVATLKGIIYSYPSPSTMFSFGNPENHGFGAYSHYLVRFHVILVMSIECWMLEDGANIVFALVGEPPFTLTYQRWEPPARSGGKGAYGRVLETHTISAISANEYSTFASQEGMSESEIILYLRQVNSALLLGTSTSDRCYRFAPWYTPEPHRYRSEVVEYYYKEQIINCITLLPSDWNDGPSLAPMVVG